MEESEELRWAIKIVIKRQMRGLIELLRENGEEIAIVSADVEGGSCSHFGSPEGEWFMSEQRNITTNFLNFCKNRGKKKLRKGFPNRGISLPSFSNVQDFEEIPEVPVHSHSEELQNTRPTSGLTHNNPSKTVLRVSVPEYMAYGTTNEELAGLVGQIVVAKLTDSLYVGKSPVKAGTLGISVKRTRSGRAVCTPRNLKISPAMDATDSKSDIISHLTNLSQEQLKRYEVCTVSGITVDLQSVSSTAQQMEMLAEPVIQAIDDLDVLGKLKNSSKSTKVIVSKHSIGDRVLVDVEEPEIDKALSSLPGDTIDIYLDIDVSDREDSDHYDEESVEDQEIGQLQKVNITTNTLKDTLEKTAFTKVMDKKKLSGNIGTKIKKMTKQLDYEQPQNALEGTMKKNPAFAKIKGTKKKDMSVSIGTKVKKMTISEKRKQLVQCPHCGISLVGERNLKPHIDRVHLKIRNHKCAICSKGFWSACGLENHVISVHTRKCESCQEYVVESVAWEEGIASSDPREVTCQCGASVTIVSKTGVKHKKIDVIEKDDDDANSFRRNIGSTQKFACGVCDKLFLSKRECEEHSLCHSSIKKFTCEVCGAGYKGKTMLCRHMFTEHGIYQNKCEVCLKNFNNAASLKVHMGKLHPTTLNNPAEVDISSRNKEHKLNTPSIEMFFHSSSMS